jgi:glycosyltransferase involved in cell wall biosynthesis
MISIIIPSYNYARYLPATIESALAQGGGCEIIAVDDGSTDNSLEVLEGYRDRIQVIAKENGGEATAIVAGLERARGDTIIVLDSDDMLLPGCAEAVTRAMAPDVAKVQYRLRIINAHGKDMGLRFPNYPSDFGPDDVWQMSLDGGYPAPPTTGNAYSRRFLERILPVDSRFRNHFDAYANRLAPLYGRVVTLPCEFAMYRVHNRNYSMYSDLTPRWSVELRNEIGLQELFEEHGRKLGIEVPRQALLNWPEHFEKRILSFRLTPDRHPLPDNGVVPLLWHGLRATRRCSQLTPFARLLWAGYLTFLATAPRATLRSLLPAMRGYTKRSAWVRTLTSLARRRGASPRPSPSMASP